MTALELDEGLLIYCQADSSPPEHEIVVRATGTRLWAYRLPMGGTTAEWRPVWRIWPTG